MKKILLFMGVTLFSANFTTLSATEEVLSKISSLTKEMNKRNKEILEIQENQDYKNKKNNFLDYEMTLCRLELSNYQDEKKIKELEALQAAWDSSPNHKKPNEHIEIIINKYTARDYSYIY